MNRSVRGFVIVALATSCCLGCAISARPGGERTVLSPDSALVYVYVAAPDDPALRSLRVAGAALVRDDGTEAPLGILASALAGKRGGGERLVASGGAQAGRFQALVLRVSSPGAAEGAPGDELRAPLAFALSARQGAVIDARLELRPGTSPDASAATVLAAEIAPYPTFGVMGLVSSACDDAVVVLDKLSGRVGAVMRTGRSPAGIAIDSERRRGYVVTTKDDAVSILDLDQGAVTTTRLLRMGDAPVAVEIAPDRTSLLVVNRGSGTLSFVEPEGLSETDRLQVGSAPTDLAVERAGQRAFVFNSLSSSVSVVDLRARQVVGVVPVDAGPIRGVFDRAQVRLWVLHDGSPSLTCIDTRTLAVIERLNLGAGATALRVDPRTDRIFVARRDGSSIDAYDPLSLLPVESLPVGGRPDYLAIDGESRNLGAALTAENRVEAVGVVRKGRAWAADVREPVFIRFVGER